MSNGELKSKDKDEEPVILSDLVTRKEDVLEMQSSWEVALQDLITERNNVDQTPQGKERDPESQSSRTHVTQTSQRDGDLLMKANQRNLVTMGRKDSDPLREHKTQWEPSRRDGSRLIHSNLDGERNGNLERHGDLVIQMEKDPVSRIKASSDSGFKDSDRFLSTMSGSCRRAECSNHSSGYHANSSSAVSGARVRPRPHWCHLLAWALCVLLSLCCLLLSTLLGIRWDPSCLSLNICQRLFLIVFQ